MPTVENLSGEQNFSTHWMFNTSRAGVLLDPSFTGLNFKKENLLPGPENITTLPEEVVHLSHSCSVSDDSLCEESGSSQTLQQCTTGTPFPAAAANLESSKPDLVHGEVGGQKKSCPSDTLLQRLEQVINIPRIPRHIYSEIYFVPAYDFSCLQVSKPLATYRPEQA